jgi:hypothetical protein
MLTERQAAEVGFTFPNPAPSVPQMHHVPMQSKGHGARLAHHLSTPLAATKPRCTLLRCNRVAAAECGLCKSCCEGRGQGCSSSKHRSGPPRQKVISTFTPSRPPAASPPLPTAASTSTAPSFNFQNSTPLESSFTAELPVTGRSFREEMPDEWAKEWNERQRKVKEKREMEELRRKNELAIARQVVIQLWRTVCPIHLFPPISTHPLPSEWLPPHRNSSTKHPYLSNV